MKAPAISVLCGLAAMACAQANPLCEAAQAGLERLAEARGLSAEVRCRAAASAEMGGASLLAEDWPSAQGVRSGPMTWPVRVQRRDGRTHVQQVPLTVAWTAPAWVGVRHLEPRAELRPGDVDLQPRRWPEGLIVEVGDSRSPPSGRLRRALRAGEVLTSAALLPTDALVRGDPVVAVVAQGGLEIRLQARLLLPTRVGELARAQVPGRMTPLEGRMVDAQTLAVNP